MKRRIVIYVLWLLAGFFLSCVRGQEFDDLLFLYALHPSAPGITDQPDSTGAVTNTTANFTVTASGSAPLAYQWMRNGSSIEDSTQYAYSGSTSSALSFTPYLTNLDASSFTVIVTNTLGAVTSSVAVLTVTNAPEAGNGLPAFVQENVFLSMNNSATTIGTNLVVSAGNALVAVCRWNETGTLTVGDSQTNVWTPIYASASGGFRLSSWLATNLIAGDTSVTVTGTVAATYGSIQLLEYTNVSRLLTNSVADETSTGTGITLSTTTNNTLLLIVASVENSQGTLTTSALFTNRVTTGYPTVADRVWSSSGESTAYVTNSQSGHWVGVHAALQ